MSIISKSIGVFKDFKWAIKREFRARQFKPLYTLAFLTYRCTSMCKCCNIWKRNRKDSDNEMGIKEWKIIIDKLHKNGVGGIEIFGGDALLRKDIIFDLINYCTFKGIETYLPTNSNLIDRETARLLVESGLTTFYFSLDGTPEIHDKVRGQKGSYNRVIKAITEVAEFKNRNKRELPEIVVNTTISSLNYKCIPDFLKEISHLPVDVVEFCYLSEVPEESICVSGVNGIIPDPYFVTTDGNSHLLSSEEVQHLRNIIQKVWKKRDQYPFRILIDNLLLISQSGFERGEFPQVFCLRSCIEPTISPYGEVLPCPFYSRYSLGNLYEDEFHLIWGNELHKQFVAEQKKGNIKICKYCNTLLFKRGLYLTLKRYLKQWFL